MITIQEHGDGTATVLRPSPAPCPVCSRLTWQLQFHVDAFDIPLITHV